MSHAKFLENYAVPGEHFTVKDHPFAFDGKLPARDLIDAAISHPDTKVREAAAKRSDLTDSDISKLIGDSSDRVVFSAIANPNAKSHHMSLAYNGGRSSAKQAVISDHRAPVDLLRSAIADTNEGLRFAAVYNPLAPKDVLDIGINDPSHRVRAYAALNPNATIHHVERGLTDPDEWVRSHAMQSNLLTMDHIKVGLQDSSASVRARAARHPLMRYST